MGAEPFPAGSEVISLLVAVSSALLTVSEVSPALPDAVEALDESEELCGIDVVEGAEVDAEVGAAVVVGVGLGLPVVLPPGAVVGAGPTGALDAEVED